MALRSTNSTEIGSRQQKHLSPFRFNFEYEQDNAEEDETLEVGFGPERELSSVWQFGQVSPTGSEYSSRGKSSSPGIVEGSPERSTPASPELSIFDERSRSPKELDDNPELRTKMDNGFMTFSEKDDCYESPLMQTYRSPKNKYVNMYTNPRYNIPTAEPDTCCDTEPTEKMSFPTSQLRECKISFPQCIRELEFRDLSKCGTASLQTCLHFQYSRIADAADSCDSSSSEDSLFNDREGRLSSEPACCVRWAPSPDAVDGMSSVAPNRSTSTSLKRSRNGSTSTVETDSSPEPSPGEDIMLCVPEPDLSGEALKSPDCLPLLSADNHSEHKATVAADLATAVSEVHLPSESIPTEQRNYSLQEEVDDSEFNRPVKKPRMSMRKRKTWKQRYGYEKKMLKHYGIYDPDLFRKVKQAEKEAMMKSIDILKRNIERRYNLIYKTNLPCGSEPCSTSYGSRAD